MAKESRTENGTEKRENPLKDFKYPKCEVKGCNEDGAHRSLAKRTLCKKHYWRWLCTGVVGGAVVVGMVLYFS